MTPNNQSQLWQVVGFAVLVVLVAIVAVFGLRPTQRTTFRAVETPPSESPPADEEAAPTSPKSADAQLLDPAIRLWSSAEDADLDRVQKLLEDAASASPGSAEIKAALVIFWAERFSKEQSPEAREKAAAYALEVEAIDSSSPLAKVSQALVSAMTTQDERAQDGRAQDGRAQGAQTSLGEALQARQDCLPKQLCDRGYRLLEKAP